MEPDAKPGHPTLGMHIWGWMTPTELTWLGDHASQMRSVVEVGSLHGRSAFMLLSSCDGHVACIDPWNDEGGHCLPSFWGNCGHFDNLVAVQGYSPSVIPRVISEIGKPDMVFIDGNHDEASVRADVEGWLPLTQRLICGHDYQNANGGYPDVKLVVDEVFGERVRVAKNTAIWYVDLA